MKKLNITGGDWKRRQLFESPILVIDEDANREWYFNNIEIHDNNGRIICTVAYQTDTENQGWGNNETIAKWEANSELIADAGTTANKCGLLPSELLKQRDELLETLEHIIEYWNKDRNDNAMHDALWHIIETAEKAINNVTNN